MVLVYRGNPIRISLESILLFLFSSFVLNSSRNSYILFIACTGCSLNIVFFLKILEYSGLWSFSVFPLCQCVYTHQVGRTPALQQNWQSSEKSQHFKEKTQYLMNILYVILTLFYINLPTQRWPNVYLTIFLVRLIHLMDLKRQS